MEDSSSSSSDSSSTEDEERLRRLFTACDRDNDGLIDCQDLQYMCQLLNVKESVDEIMNDLGVEKHRRISFEEFVRCRKQLTDEAGLMLQTFADREIDEGAANLSSIEADYNLPSLYELFRCHNPKLLQRYSELSSTNQPNIGHLNVLEVADPFHLATLSSLKGELIELNNRLKRTKSEKGLLEKQLSKIQVEKLQIQKDSEDRFDQQMTRYEDRITELHGVIAELRKKSDQRQISVIREEDELEESDGILSNTTNEANSFNDDMPICAQNVSLVDSELNLELSRVISELESAIDERHQLTVSPHETNRNKGLSCLLTKEEKAIQACVDRDVMGGTCFMDSSEDLEKRVSNLEHLNQSLKELNGSHKSEISQLRSQMDDISDERDKLKHKLEEIHLRGKTVEIMSPSLPLNNRNNSFSPPEDRGRSQIFSTGSSVPMTKVAELKKLRTGERDRPVLGAEISSVGLPNAKVAEHLAHSMQENSSFQEMLQSLQKGNGADGEERQLPLAKIWEFEIERERLQSKVDHLGSQIDLLNLTLAESKSHCDRLTVLLGKYESNNTALKMSLGYSDQLFEVYDVMVKLLDTELAQLFTRCRTGGDLRNFNDQNSSAIRQNILMSRRAVEMAARQLLLRLDHSGTNVNEPGIVSPWEDSPSSRTNSTTSSTAGAEDDEFTESDERRLREYLQQLKADRNVVQLTMLELESVHLDPSFSDFNLNPDAQRLDLENAVLLQELMAMKEEKSELKARNYLLEKQRVVLESSLKKISQRCRCCLDLPTGHEATDELKPTQSLNDATNNGIELSGVLRREARLGAQILELTAALENLSRNSDMRQQQSAEFVNELKRANSALVSAFEKTKRKYLDKMKKMEVHLQDTKEHYEMELKLMRQELMTPEMQRRN